MSSEFFARPASDRTDDWPFWFVARRDQPGRNVLAEACEVAGIPRSPGAVLALREDAEFLARKANEAEQLK